MLPVLCTIFAIQLQTCYIDAISALVSHSCMLAARHTSVHAQIAYLSAVV